MKKITILSMFFLTMLIKSSIAQTSPTLSAPDGITYHVDYSEQVLLASAASCGYNDAGLPNMGYYRREHRTYTEYSKGKLLRSWTDVVDVFTRCYEP